MPDTGLNEDRGLVTTKAAVEANVTVTWRKLPDKVVNCTKKNDAREMKLYYNRWSAATSRSVTSVLLTATDRNSNLAKNQVVQDMISAAPQ